MLLIVLYRYSEMSRCKLHKLVAERSASNSLMRAGSGPSIRTRPDGCISADRVDGACTLTCTNAPGGHWKTGLAGIERARLIQLTAHLLTPTPQTGPQKPVANGLACPQTHQQLRRPKSDANTKRAGHSQTCTKELALLVKSHG